MLVFSGPVAKTNLSMWAALKTTSNSMLSSSAAFFAISAASMRRASSRRNWPAKHEVKWAENWKIIILWNNYREKRKNSGKGDTKLRFMCTVHLRAHYLVILYIPFPWLQGIAMYLIWYVNKFFFLKIPQRRLKQEIKWTNLKIYYRYVKMFLKSKAI